MQQRPELQNVTDMMDIHICVKILQLGAKIVQNQAFLERFMQLVQAFRIKTSPTSQKEPKLERFMRFSRGKHLVCVK